MCTTPQIVCERGHLSWFWALITFQNRHVFLLYAVALLLKIEGVVLNGKELVLNRAKSNENSFFLLQYLYSKCFIANRFWFQKSPISKQWIHYWWRNKWTVIRPISPLIKKWILWRNSGEPKATQQSSSPRPLCTLGIVRSLESPQSRPKLWPGLLRGLYAALRQIIFE